ncbi:MAG: amylo-alpha-1,6-glucosidase [Acidobacteriaceae bacterium]
MISRRGFMGGMTAMTLASWNRLNAAVSALPESMSAEAHSMARNEKSSVKIGNFFYTAPNGVAFIYEDSAAFVMNPGGTYNAGTVAADDLFHKVIFVPEKVTPKPPRVSFQGQQRVEFQWSRMGDVMVGRLVSAVAGEMSFKIDENWPGFHSEFSAEDGGIKGEANLPAGNTVTWRLKAQPAVKSLDAKEFTVVLGGMKEPTYLVAGFGELPAFEAIDNHLAEAEKAYDARRPKAQGPSGDILAAIADNLNNSRVYSNDNKQVAITVCRTFGADSANTCPYFCWDSFFNGLLACLADPEMGRQTVRAMLSYQTSEGLVPNFAHWFVKTSDDRSEPPVGALCVWKMHQHHPDIEFLREVYPKLALWNAWWMKERDARNDGMLEWGSSTGILQNAQYETGWDDTPQFEGVKGVQMVGHTMNAYAVDLCSLWSADAHHLALIADAIGRAEDAKRHRRDADAMNDRINTRLWNEQLGIYCSRFWDKDDGTPGEFLTRLTPANFYPLICGAADAERGRKLLSVMTDPTQFWGQWILPTVSRQDPLFLEQHYWHGSIWGPVNYLVFQGVKRYATPEVKIAFAEKSVHLFMDNWLADGFCGENYYSINGGVGGRPNYTWGALLCLIGLESIIDIADDGRLVTGLGYNEPVELMNIPIHGKPHRISLRMGKPEVTVM